MDTLLSDLRYGFRMLVKNPAVTAIAVTALALGIGSSTAIFSVVDAVLLRPLPYKDAGQLVVLSEKNRSTGENWQNASPANYLDWKAQNQVFSGMAALRSWSGNLTGGSRPERVVGAMTTSSLFPLLGVQPILGRSLLAADEADGHDHVIVLSETLWKRSFGSDRNLLGRDIVLDEQPYTVVGIMPADFQPFGADEFWVPSPYSVPTHPLLQGKDPRQFRDRSYLDILGRLKAGVSLKQASAQMDTVARELERRYPQTNAEVAVAVSSLRDDLVGDVRPSLLILLAAVGFVLLIACANVANLLLARASARAREVSIRTALGADRLCIVRQFLTESVMLSFFSGILGTLLALWAMPALLALSPREIRSTSHVGINIPVLLFALAISALTGIVFGLLPALQASRPDLNESLKEGERGTGAGLRRSRARSALVVAEVGLSLVLLVGAGLLVRSFSRLMRVDPGFDPRHVLTFALTTAPSQTPDQKLAFYDKVLDSLRSLPGVQSVGAVSRLPLTGGNSTRSLIIPGRTDQPSADFRVSTPDYFRTLAVPLLQGRMFTPADRNDSTLVAVVNERFAKTIFPGENPIGKRFNWEAGQPLIEIVGVIGNVHHVGLEFAPRPEMYIPLAQMNWHGMTVVVRTAMPDPMSLLPAAQRAVWSVDKNVALGNARSLEQVISTSVSRRRFSMLLLTIFACGALLLAAIGLYGVMSYSVTQRTYEIGIRIALGARQHHVLRMVLGQGLLLTMIGIGAGLIASLAVTRTLGNLLFGVGATDPLTFAAVAIVLMVVAVLAVYVPARRATKVDPIIALRYE